MERILKKLDPERVFYYFEEITKIPRCSGEEKKISDYLVDFAKKNKLEVIQDEALNVIIKKKGTLGYENSPVVVLQGHMDMVGEKNEGADHDFSKDSIEIFIEGDFIKAKETTLGADDGIAVAMSLAILESKDIPHPPLEVLITTNEETGMNGAMSLNPEFIRGRILINLDSEEEGILLVSCAGGERNKVTIPIIWEENKKEMEGYIIKTEGLLGGHSGAEINKGRGNSNKILGRILNSINEKLGINLYRISGGAKTNAIPRTAEAGIVVEKGKTGILKKEISVIEDELKNELRCTDKNIKITLNLDTEEINKIYSKSTSDNIINFLMITPNGVKTMSGEILGLVESSSNIGIVHSTEKEVIFESSIRSSKKSLQKYISRITKIAGEVSGGRWESYSSYPAWEYNPNSYIRDLFKNTYKDIYGKDIKIEAIHAGLECGLFKEKFEDMDMVSLGPDMVGVHTPEERLSISSTKRTWELLTEVLKKIK